MTTENGNSNGNGSKRPYRLWDAKAKKHIRYRYFAIPVHAHWAAMQELRWAAVGCTIEILDISHANKELGQYTRRVNSLTFSGPARKPERKEE